MFWSAVKQEEAGQWRVLKMCLGIVLSMPEGSVATIVDSAVTYSYNRKEFHGAENVLVLVLLSIYQHDLKMYIVKFYVRKYQNDTVKKSI